MAARLVFSWRGVLRGDLVAARKYLNSLLSYNTKHPTVGFLTTTQVTTISTVLLLIGDRNTGSSLLGAKKPR